MRYMPNLTNPDTDATKPATSAGFSLGVGVGQSLERSTTGNRTVSHADKKLPVGNNSNEQMAVWGGRVESQALLLPRPAG